MGLKKIEKNIIHFFFQLATGTLLFATVFISVVYDSLGNVADRQNRSQEAAGNFGRTDGCELHELGLLLYSLQ